MYHGIVNFPFYAHSFHLNEDITFENLIVVKKVVVFIIEVNIIMAANVIKNLLIIDKIDSFSEVWGLQQRSYQKSVKVKVSQRRPSASYPGSLIHKISLYSKASVVILSVLLYSEQKAGTSELRRKGSCNFLKKKILRNTAENGHSDDPELGELITWN